MTAADGQFNFTTQAGTYRLVVTADGYQPYTTADIEVTDNLLTSDISLTPMIAEEADHMVLITENGFEPAVLNAEVGDVVEWVNVDLVEHTVYGIDMDSGILASGESYKFRVTIEGTLVYEDAADVGSSGYVVTTAVSGNTIYLPLVTRP